MGPMSSIENNDYSIFVKEDDIHLFFEKSNIFAVGNGNFDKYFQNKIISIFPDANNHNFCLINDLNDINLVSIISKKKDIQKTLNDTRLEMLDSNLCFLLGSNTSIRVIIWRIMNPSSLLLFAISYSILRMKILMT